MKTSLYDSKNYMLTKNKQLGLSLIELMVSMFVGLFLIIGVTTSYLSSQKSSLSRDQMSILQDNGRAALEILAKTLQHTGYRSTEAALLENSFLVGEQPSSSSCGTENSIQTPTSGGSLFPITGTIDDNDGDTVVAVNLGDDHVNKDCAGGILPEVCRVGGSVEANANKIFNAFFIDADDNLQCAGSRSTELQTIAEGVENIQILYGMNTDSDTTKSVDRYVNASGVGNDWGQVVSIQVAILVRTLIPVKSEDETQSFSLLDVKVDSDNDSYQRAVFSTTINLRNL